MQVSGVPAAMRTHRAPHIKKMNPPISWGAGHSFSLPDVLRQALTAFLSKPESLTSKA